jgi:hypothetical protein
MNLARQMKRRRKKALMGFKNKGGAKLTTTMSALGTILRATGEGQFTTMMLDSDGFNRTLTEMMGERDDNGRLKPSEQQSQNRGVISADLFEVDGGEALFAAAESDADIVIIDTPAGGLDKVNDLSSNLAALDLIEQFIAHERDVAIITPFDPFPGTIRGVKSALERFGNHVTHIAARDMVGKSAKDYRLWNRDDVVDRFGRIISGKTRKALEAAGGIEIQIHGLHAGTFALMRALALDFNTAATATDIRSWESWDSMGVRNWLKAWFPELDKLRPFLEIDESIEWKGWR